MEILRSAVHVLKLKTANKSHQIEATVVCVHKLGRGGSIST